MKFEAFRSILGYVFLSAIILLILAGSYFRLLDNYELDALDLRFWLRPRMPVTDKIVIIEIGDDTIEKLGRFPFARSYHATLIQALTENKAKAVVLDIFFSEPQDDDSQLEAAISLAGNVYLPYVLELDIKKKQDIVSASGYTAQSLEDFTIPARGGGHINVIPDIDGKFRRVPAYIKYGNRHHPYLSFLVSCDYLGISQDKVKIIPGKYVMCGPGTKIPLDVNSNIIVNFSGKWGKSYKHYSYVDVLQSYIAKFSGERPVLDLSVFKDKICMIGLTATGTTDLHPNPFEPLYPAVGMHADVFNSIVNNNFIARASRLVNLLILLFLSLLTSLAAFKTRPLKGLCILLAMIFIFALAGILMFNIFGIWIDVLYPILAMAFVYLSCTLCKYVMEWKRRLLLENELHIARKIQQSFLPKSLPDNAKVEVAANMFTAWDVGGDLYDFLEFSKDQLGVMIGDVSGKGIPASLFMTMAAGAFKFFAMPEVEPGDTLLNLNSKLIRESSSNLFVTMFYSMFDTKNRVMTYANGGHLPVLYLAKDKPPEFLDVDEGCPLGMIESSYSGGRINFGKGDIFIFYTDGVTEAMNTKGEMYGQDRLASVAVKNRSHSSRILLEAIEKDVRKFEPERKQHDDITIIVIKIV